MVTPRNIKFNLNAPFPSLVTGSGPITVGKQNGIWTVGFNGASLGGASVQLPTNVQYSTDYALVWDSIAKQFISVPLANIRDDHYNVVNEGADPTGAHDSTQAIRNADAAAAAAKKALFFPAGTYLVSSAIVPSAGARWIGESFQNTAIITTSATANILTIDNPFVSIDNLQFASSVTKTAGWFIDIGAGAFSLSNFLMVTGVLEGIRIRDQISTISISDGQIQSMTVSIGIGIRVGSGAGVAPVAITLQNLIISGDPAHKAFANIVLVNCGDITLFNCQLLASVSGVWIGPVTGQAVVSVHMIGSWMDNNSVGLEISCGGTGAFQRSLFSSCWIAQSLVKNIACDSLAGTASVDGIEFIDCEFYTGPSAPTNIVLSGPLTNFRFIGGKLGGAGAGGVTGLSINGVTGSVEVNSMRIGPNGGFGGAFAKGIDVAGTNGVVILRNNDVRGNSTSISPAGTNTTLIVKDNPGYNPVGASAAITMGGSPFTYTAGGTPETHYVRQSATNTATITKGGQQIHTLAGATTYYTIELEPGESYITTWVTTAPTYTKTVH